LREHRTRRCRRDAADREPLPRVQRLGEQYEPGQRACDRLEALQHADGPWRQRVQRGEVERVGEHRRQDGDEQPDGQRGRVEQGGTRRRDAERERQEGGPRHGEGERSGGGRAGEPAEQQVAAHGHARAQREEHAGERERTGRRADQEHPRAGEQRPPGVERTAGPRQRDREGAEEQQRHRDAEREVPQRGIDEVHPGDGRAERDDQPECAGLGRQPGPQDRQQDERGEPEPQRDDAGRLQQVERALPDRLPRLHADDAGEHEQRGAGHEPTLRRDSVNVQLRFPAYFLVA
jgi:hypothetical protein